jgi:Uma2 family endonuclease
MAVQLRAKLRYADLANTPDDRQRYELLDGVLVVTPSPALLHQIVSARLHERLREYFRADGGGVVFAAPTDVLLSDHDVLVPDLVVVTNHSLMTARAVEGPPTIAVEILSPSNVRYDRVRKAERYAAFGVPHYWIVDPQAKRLECYRNTNGTFVEIVRCSDGQFAHPDFVGLTFDVAGLWNPDWTQ